MFYASQQYQINKKTFMPSKHSTKIKSKWQAWSLHSYPSSLGNLLQTGNYHHKGIEIPWGTNPQLFDSKDKLDNSLADAIALCSGIIVPKLLSSKGNREAREMRVGAGGFDLREERRGERGAFLLSLRARGCNREDNRETTLKDAITSEIGVRDLSLLYL